MQQDGGAAHAFEIGRENMAESRAASETFGVIRVASGSRWRTIAVAVSDVAKASPLVAASTGSRTMKRAYKTRAYRRLPRR